MLNVELATNMNIGDKENFEDRILFLEEKDQKLFAIADGMGDSGFGAVAAEKALEVLERHFPLKEFDKEEIEEIFKKANKEVMNAVYEMGGISGTTLSAMYLKGDFFIIGHTGDSKIYRFRKGELKQLTEDTVEERKGRKKVRALGTDWNPPVVIKKGKVLPGDLYLLVSDGIEKLLTFEELKEFFNEYGDLPVGEISDRLSFLFKTSKRKKSIDRDNIAYIVFRV
ncbi:MAG: serine/threonine-protein phosphatase [Aquificae bacterium]|nr:serine/threonine-protein phosphatase [Aquificota bacterium]